MQKHSSRKRGLSMFDPITIYLSWIWGLRNQINPFAKQIKWLISIWKATLGWNGLIEEISTNLKNLTNLLREIESDFLTVRWVYTFKFIWRFANNHFCKIKWHMKPFIWGFTIKAEKVLVFENCKNGET